MGERVWFVYLLVCRNGRIYTGVTPDLERRIAAHRDGKGARFTRGNPPEHVLAIHSFTGKIAAMQMEARIKQMRREHKVALARAWVTEFPVAELSHKLLPQLAPSLAHTAIA
jgi:putative endonuclease